MKIIIAFIVIVMSMVVNTANAEITATVQSQDNVRKYVTKSIPDASEEEIGKCYNAVKNGGSYTVERKRVKIECAEEEMIVFRRLFF